MKISKKIISVVTGLTVAAMSLLGSPVYAAGSATYALSGNGSTVNINTTVAVTLTESSTDPVNVVTAKLAYDATKLEFVSVDASGSGFGSEAATSGGSGSIEVSRFVPAGGTVTGTQKVATVNFKALVGSGSTAVSFTDGSRIYSNGTDVWNHAATSATYNLVTPAPAPAPTPTPTPTQGGMGGGGSSTPTPVTNNTVNNSVGNNGDTPAKTDENKGEVKAENNATPKTSKPGTPAKDATTTKKSNRSIWPWVILMILGAIATLYGLRGQQKAKSVATSEAAPSKAKKDNKSQATSTPVVAKTSKKSATSAKRSKKSGKRSNKRSR